MPEITMPRLSDSMEEGTILRWLVTDGAEVARGDEIAEIETDKANMTYEADAAGTFRAVASEGDALPVGAVIAHVLGDGEEAPSGGAPAAAPAGPVDSGRAHTGLAAGARASSSPPAGSAAASDDSAPGVGDGARVKASPVARRLARELGVDLASLAGSGPSGRIVKADVEAAAAEPQAAPTSQASPPPTAGGSAAAPSAPAAGPVGAGGKGEVTTVELTSTQKTIARRMAESKATVPDFQVRTEADVTDLLTLRKQMKAAQESAPSVNDFVVKACGLALREHPRANGAYRDGAFELYGRANVGVAVAAEGMLIVPTIFDADAQPVTAIAQTTRALAARVRDGKILPPELSGGTFTVSNLGMFGVTSFTAVVNPGQAAILAVGAAVERPTVTADGSLVPRALMDLSLSCDHRILYGADAAQFLARVRELLQTPFALLA
ncbi:MAG TPA: dihydrolipoamide acetyltransferase family protein [Conexibacter sp.]|nr:dihydrolipoamide acetyltransferase family protein [Conexibacter sp.]